ncbi:MAG TPA: SDR family NAD(P)-dependent oxidoreductase [Gemmatirosa sp.]
MSSPPTRTDPRSPIALVTGATDGIGRATAAELARRGYTVLVHGRDASRATAVADAIRAAGGQARPAIADLARLADVARLAAELRDTAPRLDVLVNNAGVAFRGGARHVSADGYELTFAVNHLAHFLLTVELLPLLEATGHARGDAGSAGTGTTGAGPARVATVASELHARGRIAFDDLQAERRYSGSAAYADSKLANVLFARALARRTDAQVVVSHALHPGVVKTKLLRDGFGSNGGISTERGAATSVVVATSAEAGRTTGGYWAHEAPAQPAPQGLDDTAGERLWAASDALVARWRSGAVARQ